MSNINENPVSYIPIVPNTIIDEVSSEEFYIGKSINTKSQTATTWSIKKIWKVGTVWNFGFPDGNQEYSFAWSDRVGYDYK